MGILAELSFRGKRLYPSRDRDTIEIMKGKIENKETVKLVVFVPETHANQVRKAMGEAGAGLVGDYAFCSFSVKGVGRFVPLKSAHPTIGEVGKLGEVREERIETVCYKKDLDRIIRAIYRVHPYEEVAIDVYPLVLNPHKTTFSPLKK